MSLLVVNQLIEATAGSRTERILWVHPEGGGYFVIDVRDKSALPLFQSEKEIIELFDQKKVKVTKTLN